MLTLLLAVVAVALLGGGSVMQQRAAWESSRLVGPPRAGLRMTNLLLGSPLWLGGAALAVVGFAFHAAALHLGSLAVVQPVMTLVLPASVLLSRSRSRPAARGDWLGIGALCAGVALFLVVAAPRSGPQRPPVVLLLAAAVTAAVVVFLYLVGRNGSPAARGLSWGTAAAVAFGLAAALTKAAAADLATGGVPAALTSWPAWALVAAAGVGLALEQAAFAVAPLAAVMMPVTLVNPVVATALGLFAWRAHFAGGTTGVAAATLAAFALAALGVAVLSRSPLLNPAPARVR